MDSPSGNPWAEPTPIPQTQDPSQPSTQYPPSGGGGLQLINNLGYNPSYPYGSGGSGVPTQTGGGIGGSLLGAVLMGLATGGLGIPLGAKLGGIGGRMLTRYIQGIGMNKQPGQPAPPGQPAQPQAPSGSPGDGGFNFNFSNFFPKGLGFLGQNPGDNPAFVQWNRPEGFDPNSSGPNSYGGGPLSAGPNQPGWIGGSAFGGRGSPIVPGGGFFDNSGSIPTLGSGFQDYMAKIAIHDPRFTSYNQNNPYFWSTGLPSLFASLQGHGGGGHGGGGQGVGGSEKPFTQNK